LRYRPGLTLGIIALITLVAGWLVLPSNVADPFNWKENVYYYQGLDLQGGLQVVLEARPPEGQDVTDEMLAGTRDTVERRVSGLGVSEPLIQTRGDDQIIVELPGVGDPESAVQVIAQTALLEIIDPQGEYLPEGTIVNTTAGMADNQIIEAELEEDPGAQLPEEDEPVYQTIITGADLTDAYPQQDEVGRLVVGFELDSDAADEFFQFTSANIGQPMSVVLDKRVISTATIQSGIRDRGQISGPAREEVHNLVAQLQAGSLAVPLEVVQSRTVGPTLGQESIDASLQAGAVGLALVVLFMILYYRLPGVLSILALGVYGLIILALFRSIPVVLTLAGLAGVILSIGMAVDANILIFSRLREELRLGHPLTRAIEDGFDRAWPSIRDSNIATMITCVILYWFGEYVGASIIQGFALTLFIGVAVSMFTAITVTRSFLRMVLASPNLRTEWWLGMELPEVDDDQPRRAAVTGDD
jgi:preprotein translocase subunit SecD